MNAPSTPTTADEVIVQLPLDDNLVESPFNPRKTYDAVSLRELADTMLPPLGRVHQAIVVRPVDLEGTPGHEIVFGHRRQRAARLAGLATIPAVVRPMSDEEARVAQLVENLQREDVHPLQEADAMHELRRRHGASIEVLMQRSGKSRSYVYNSLSLATAHDTVRVYLAEGLIDREVAVEVARLPNPLQPQALDVVGGMSSRNATAELRARWACKLGTAPFDTRSTKLVPAAGACTACPKRSDAEESLVKDYGPGVCLDRECFRTKTAQAEVAKAAALPPVQQGGKVKAGPTGGREGTEHFAPSAPRFGADAEQLTREEHAVQSNWMAVLRAVMESAANRARSVDDLRFLVLRELELAGNDFGNMAEAVLGVDFDAADDDRNRRQRRVDAVASMSPDQLATLLILVAVEGGPLYTVVDPEASRLQQRINFARQFGVDPTAVPDPSVQPPAQPAPAPASTPSTAGAGANKTIGKAGKPAVAYRCPLTGSTWSGRGLQPRWLKAALADGRKLAEFQVAAGKPAKAEQPKKAGKPAKVKDDAGDAGERDTKTLALFGDHRP